MIIGEIQCYSSGTNYQHCIVDANMRKFIICKLFNYLIWMHLMVSSREESVLACLPLEYTQLEFDRLIKISPFLQFSFNAFARIMLLEYTQLEFDRLTKISPLLQFSFNAFAHIMLLEYTQLEFDRSAASVCWLKFNSCDGFVNLFTQYVELFDRCQLSLKFSFNAFAHI